MPTYDYECKGCGHIFEYFQNMSDDPLSECPKCGSEVKRLIGGGLGVIFKGSGFYVTDNKKSSSNSASSGEAGTSKKSDSSSSGSDSSSSKPSSSSDKAKTPA